MTCQPRCPATATYFHGHRLTCTRTHPHTPPHYDPALHLNWDVDTWQSPRATAETTETRPAETTCAP
jgi:hypothetical protein